MKENEAKHLFCKVKDLDHRKRLKIVMAQKPLKKLLLALISLSAPGTQSKPGFVCPKCVAHHPIKPDGKKDIQLKCDDFL
jgi:hypothetical protein